MAATSLPQGGVVSQVYSFFPEWPSGFISSIPVQLLFFFFSFLWQHFTPPSIVYSWFSPGLLSKEPEVSFCRTWGLYSSTYLSSKMLPYGRIFLKASNVVNSLKPLLHEDSWLFHYGSQMKEFCCFWFLGSASLVGIPVSQCREASLIEQGFGLWLQSRELPTPACGTRNPEEKQNLQTGQRERNL